MQGEKYYKKVSTKTFFFNHSVAEEARHGGKTRMPLLGCGSSGNICRKGPKRAPTEKGLKGAAADVVWKTCVGSCRLQKLIPPFNTKMARRGHTGYLAPLSVFPF